MPSHALVGDVVDAYLETVDAEAPGLVEGLYLAGSAALSDFHPRTSDIDFVAVTAIRPDAAAVACLQRVHARLRERWPRPHFDGIYVTWDDLARDPIRAGPFPRSHAGRFHADGACGDPVTWHTVARHGVACRGPAPASFEVRADPAELATWTVDNLDAYWRRWLDRSSRFPSLFGMFSLTAYAAVWCVTGLSRLHYTLATGDITSKTGAAHYALETFPQ